MPIIIIGGTLLLSKYFFMPWYVTDIISYLRYSHYRRFCIILKHIFNYSYFFRNLKKRGGVLTAITKKIRILKFFDKWGPVIWMKCLGKFFLYALQSSSTFRLSLNICYICYCCFDTPCVCRGVIYVLLSITHRYRQ